MTQAPISNTPPLPLPAEIRRALGRLDRRIRVLTAARGLGRLAVVLPLGAVLGMAADFALPLPSGARWWMWGAWCAAGGLVLAGGVLGPLVRKIRPLDLAAVAERGHPEIGERLTGAVALGTERAAHALAGSPALVEALTDDAARRAGTIDPGRAVPARGPLLRLAFGLAVLALVAAPSLVFPPYRDLAQRFLTPWSDIDRVGRWMVTVQPGDTVVAVGTDLSVSAQIRPRYGRPPQPESAWLDWLDATGKKHRVEAERGDDGIYRATLPALSSTIEYRVSTDATSSRRYRAEAVEPPTITALSARVEPPAYTKLPAENARDPNRIEAWEGSRVTLTATSSASLSHIEVSWPGEKSIRQESMQITDCHIGTATLPAERSGEYTLRLCDRRCLTSRPDAPRRLIVRPDAPPVVAARGLENIQEAKPDDVLTLAVAARDDVAVASAELHYAIERKDSTGDGGGSETGHVAAALNGLGTKAARGEAALLLATLGLKPGDVVTYRVRVTDNRPAPKGPNVAWTAPRTLTIVAAAEGVLAREARARREGFQTQLDALKKAAADNRKETEQLRYAADAVQRGNGSWDKLRQLDLVQRETEARAVAQRLQKLAHDLDEDRQFRPLARPARQIAEVEAEASRAALDQARKADAADQRLNELRQADTRLLAVSERLDELQRQFDALAQRDAARQKLQDLAGREEALAARAEALHDDADRARLDPIQAEQAAVQKDLDELLRKSPELRADVLAAEAEEAEQFARQARELAARERDEAKQAADLSRHAAALKALADEQRQIEDDARRLALDVDPPLAENSRGRLNAQALREPAAPLERGDVDQARAQLLGAEAELRRLARDLEDVRDDPKALAQRLTRRQDALNRQVAEAVRDRDAEAPLAARLQPLADRQQAIARLADALAHPENSQAQLLGGKFPEEAAQAARQSTAQAVEGLRSPDQSRAVEAQRHEARRDLARLADALPDHWRRQAPAREKLNQARRLASEAAGEIDRQLASTRSPKDLADRLAPAAQKQAKAAEMLAGLEFGPRAQPQRDRAARRARALADSLKEPDRARLPELQANARAALDRLDQKLNGQVPADDLAAELAAEPAPRDAADQKRLVAALRSLNVPDAAPLQKAAIEAVGKMPSGPDKKPEPGTPHPSPDSHSPPSQPSLPDAVAALARRLADEVPDAPQPKAVADPDLPIKPAQIEQARELARRERQVRERLSALVGDRVEPQQALRGETAALGRELAEFRDQVRPLSDRGQAPANEAANLVGEQAPRAMDQGVEHLAQAQPTPARDDQRRAADLVERGAQQLDDLAVALRAEAQAQAPGQPPHPEPGEAPLAQARDAAREAARDLAQARPPQAGQALRQAAQGLRAAARPQTSDNPANDPGAEAEAALDAQSPPPAGEPKSANKDPHSAEAGTAPPDLAQLQELIRQKTGRTWGELPGHLRTEILQMSQGRYRDDYARLIQLYYREIATGAAREPKNP